MGAEFVRALVPSATAGSSELHVLDGPYVVSRGERVELPEGSKRLLVYIALSGRRVERRVAAGALWPIGNDVRAAGNLRSALWRLRCAGIDLIDGDKCGLWLRPDTVVDLSVVSDWAARLIEGRPRGVDLDTSAWQSNALELLPGWYDDWVVFERERLRQRLLHGMEALSRHLVRAGRLAEAVEAAMAVVGVDALRESAQRVLVEAHLAEGNVAEARRAFTAYREVLFRELRVQPGAELVALLGPRPREVRPIPTRMAPRDPGRARRPQV